MALAIPCRTPGAVYHTHIQPNRISLEIDLPMDLDLVDEMEAEELEAALHNQVQLVLAMYFV